MNKKLLYNVVPKDQSFTDQYAGIFHFRWVASLFDCPRRENLIIQLKSESWKDSLCVVSVFVQVSDRKLFCDCSAKISASVRLPNSEIRRANGLCVSLYNPSNHVLLLVQVLAVRRVGGRGRRWLFANARGRADVHALRVQNRILVALSFSNYCFFFSFQQ